MVKAAGRGKSKGEEPQLTALGKRSGGKHGERLSAMQELAARREAQQSERRAGREPNDTRSGGSAAEYEDFGMSRSERRAMRRGVSPSR